MDNGKKIAYLRCSTVNQHEDRQLADVMDTMDKVFTDHCSGKDTNRPQLRACLDYLRDGDTLYVHSIDRLARNLEDLRRIVTELNSRDVTVEFRKERLTFGAGATDERAKLMLTMMGAFAEFERSLILERQREGIAEAKKRNAYVNVGRKRALKDEQIEEIKARVAKGEKIARLAREYGVSRTTMYGYLKGRPKGGDVEGQIDGPRSQANQDAR